MSAGATKHSTSLIWPQGEVSFDTLTWHLKAVASMEQGTSCSWSHPGMTFTTLSIQGPHFSAHVLGQMCWRSQMVLVQGFSQANFSLCSRSIGWHNLSQTCSHSRVIIHVSLQPPSGESSKSSAQEAWITFWGWFWQTSFNSLPRLPSSCISAMIFAQRLESSSAKRVAFPMM